MAGIFTYKTINFDVANGAPAVVYTVPALTQTVVKLILAVNTNVGAQTLAIHFKPSGGTARPISEGNAPLAAVNALGSSYRDITTYLLAAGDAILMGASVATDIKGTVSFVEET